MRKLSFIIIAVLATNTAMAGGIITNTNHSAMFTRMQARDATLDIDATYYNPAGLTLLPNDGFYFSLNNQTLGQTRTITSDYNALNHSEFEGKISAPFFPGIYAVYKIGNLAISAGFNPIGGGGGGTYDKGLPSFEYQIADLVPALQSSLTPIDEAFTGLGAPDPDFNGISDYRTDISFEGTSIIFGYQLNLSYKINDVFSAAIGGRYVTGKDTYKGSLANIEIQAPEVYGGWQTAGHYLRTVAETPGLDGPTVAELERTAAYMDAATADQEVDVELTAKGFTPIIGLNIKPSDQFNIALKYEFNTKLEYSTKIIDGKDGGGMYSDTTKSHLDIPAQLVLGASYRPVEPLLISTGFHYYFDEQADWDGREDLLDGNMIEWALGLEYALSEKFAVSAGYLLTKSGATGDYQTDLSYSLPSNSIGGGFKYQLNPMIDINLAGSYTMYKEGSAEKNHDFAGSGYLVSINETYDKNVWIVAIGININLEATK